MRGTSGIEIYLFSCTQLKRLMCVTTLFTNRICGPFTSHTMRDDFILGWTLITINKFIAHSTPSLKGRRYVEVNDFFPQMNL